MMSIDVSRFIPDDVSSWPEERISSALMEQVMAGEPCGNVARVSPSAFAGIARRLLAKIEYRDNVGFLQLRAPHGLVEVTYDRVIQGDHIKLAIEGDVAVRTAHRDTLTAPQLQRRYELEERDGVLAMQQAELTREALNRLTS